jgi:hypothetical protein
LAELVLGLVLAIAGLLPGIAGFGVPFQGCIVLSSMAPSAIEGTLARKVCVRTRKFSLAMPPTPPL